jgi:hypothetical protein
MTWLTPMALAALGALVVPILLHLAAARQHDSIAFPSLQFVRALKHRRTRLRRVRDPWLLLVRILAVTALIAAFAQPVFDRLQTPQTPAQAPVLVLVDRSASMSRLNDWSTVKALARKAVDDAAGRPVALATFQRDLRIDVPFGRTGGEMRQGVENLTPGSSRGDIDRAVESAAQLLNAHPHAGGTLVIVSDLQRNGLREQRGPLVPPGLEVVLRVPDNRDGSSRSGQIESARLLGVSGARVSLELDVASTANDTSTLGASASDRGVTVELATQDGIVGQQTLSGQPHNQERRAETLRFDLVRATDRDVALHASLENEPRAWVGVLPALPPRRVWHRASGNVRERRFIAAALAQVGAEQIQFAGAEETLSLDAVDVLIDNLDRLTGDEAVPAFIANGGSVIALPPQDAGVPVAAEWLPLRELEIVASRQPLALGLFTRGHVVSNALGGVLPGGLGARPIWRHLSGTLAKDASVVARLNNSTPAIIEHRPGPGSGKVVLLAGGIAPPWSELGLEEQFAPLLVELVKSLAPRPQRPVSYAIGASVDLRAIAGADKDESLAAWTVQYPDNAVGVSAVGRGAVRLTQPGIYTVRRPGKPRMLLAANVPNQEWSTERLTAIQWQARVQIAAVTSAATESVEQAGTDGARTRPLSMLLLMLALGLFLAEALAGNQRHLRLMGATRAAPATGGAEVRR